jgi:two-component system, OmpR family, aerobic respiration control sensor histidine kinase ArcB
MNSMATETTPLHTTRKNSIYNYEHPEFISAITKPHHFVELIKSGKIKPANHKAKILLVEDERILQQVHTFFLRKVGYNFDLAETGADTLEMFYQNHYDLIILDIGLPDMSGIEVGKTIRSHEKGKNVPILALTGFGKAIEDECLAAGIDEVLDKPIGFKELASVLKKRLNKSRSNLPMAYQPSNLSAFL